MITSPGRARAGLTPPNRSSLLDDKTTAAPDHERSIPIRLRALRLSLGLSAAMLDRHAGFVIGTIGRLERGDLRIYATHLYRIGEALGVSIGYFYGQPDVPQAGETNDDPELEKQCLLSAYMKIKDPTLKRDVFELIETLALQSQNKAR